MDSVGHSLGGALASIAALSVQSNIPSAVVRLFTYGALTWAYSKCQESDPYFFMRVGQPRTGNVAYADLVEAIVGLGNIFRGKFLILRAKGGYANLIVL